MFAEISQFEPVPLDFDIDEIPDNPDPDWDDSLVQFYEQPEQPRPEAAGKYELIEDEEAEVGTGKFLRVFAH